MQIGILGSGLMGSKLGTLFARAGHQVTFSYSRDRRHLERLARSAGPRARAGTPAEAVQSADAVLLAVHWTRVDDVLSQVGDGLSDRLLVTCSLPMSADDSDLVVGHSTSGAEVLAGKLPETRVVSAFSSVPSEVLFSVFAAREQGVRPDLVYCGDHPAAKHMAAGLIRDLGFNPVDLGALANARYVEPFSLLVAQIAYGGSGSPALAYRFEHLERVSTPPSQSSPPSRSRLRES